MLAIAAALVGGLLISAPGTALAQGNYSITFAARVCPDYSDVYANRARNNVLESLQDLGPNSPYGPIWENVPDDPQVQPSVEDNPHGSQALAPNGPCRPLNGWKFTLGTGKVPVAVLGAWGALSKVTGDPALPDYPGNGCPGHNCAPLYDPTLPIFGAPSPTPFPAPIVTEGSTPLLDQNGQPVMNGGHEEMLPGAVTLDLSPAQVDAARSGIDCGGYGSHDVPMDVCDGGLWTMGGTPADPVLANEFGGPQTPDYAYAALRCAVDNNYGDNVDIVQFPTGTTHVFCYAYYVRPAPPAGTITIKKVIEGANGQSPTFLFDGTINFGTSPFPLPTQTATPALSQSFRRAAGQPWTVTEKEVPDWHLDSITCDAPNTPGHSSASISGSTATIDLAEGEHVTCTFTNKFGPPTGGLRLTKITQGGVGTFHYHVTPVGRRGRRQSVSARTFLPGVPVDAVPSLTHLTGPYRITEVAPKTPDGRWRQLSVECVTNGTRKRTTGSVEVTLSSNTGTVCTFTNRFIPRGSISIGKITRGATGTANFVVSGSPATPNSNQVPQLDRRLSVTTKAEGIEALAKPDTPGLDSTNRLRLGQYRILEAGPAGDGWSLTGVTCNGVEVPFAQGAIFVRLTRDQPHLHCVFTDTFTKKPPPEPKPDPPAPLPPPAPPGRDPLQPAQQSADLTVTKHASTPVATRRNTVTFRITVTNHGPDHASRVVLHDQLFGSARLVAIHTDAGRCSARLPVVCQLGTLRPRALAHITVRLRVTARSRFADRAVVGAATHDPRLTNNIARAVVRVVRPPAPSVTG